LGPGFKYHVISISAIFFALTVGLVVGSVFVSPQFANRQEVAIRRLQDTLNTDIEEKRREIDQYRQCVETISPLALTGKLGNSVVAVIQTGDYTDAATRANEAIAMANPRGIVHLAVTPILDRTPEEIDAALAGSRASSPSLPADRDALFQTIASALARGDGQHAPLLTALDHEGYIRLTADDDYAQPVRMAVIVAGSRSADSLRAPRVDVPLIRALLKQGITVVACEGRDAVASDVPSFRVLRDEISTVDNVDTDVGKCALVLAFTGVHGEYGVKPGAAHVMPIAQDSQ
jgi:hypothetical protein